MSTPQNLKRAALLLQSLPKAQAARLISRLEARELKVVYKAMQHLSPQDRAQCDAVLDAFLQQLSAERSGARRATGHRSTDSSNQAPTGYDPFRFFVDLAPELQTRLLKVEHPRNIALVLSFLPTAMASRVLATLDIELRISVIRRLCSIDDFNPDEVDRLAQDIRRRLDSLLSRNDKKRGGVSVVTRLLSCVDPDTCESILTYLDGNDPDLAGQIKSQVFSFQRIADLPDDQIKTILKNVDTSCWAPALKRCSLKVQRKILSNLAQRPAQLLSMELANMHPVGPEICRQAQSHVVQTCLSLHDQGKIDLGLAMSSGSAAARTSRTV